MYQPSPYSSAHNLLPDDYFKEEENVHPSSYSTYNNNFLMTTTHHQQLKRSNDDTIIPLNDLNSNDKCAKNAFEKQLDENNNDDEKKVLLSKNQVSSVASSSNSDDDVQKTQAILIKMIDYYGVRNHPLKSLTKTDFLQSTFKLHIESNNFINEAGKPYPEILHLIPKGHPLLVFLSDLGVHPFESCLSLSVSKGSKKISNEERNQLPTCDFILLKLDDNLLHAYPDDIVDVACEKMTSILKYYGFSAKYQTITYPLVAHDQEKAETKYHFDNHIKKNLKKQD